MERTSISPWRFDQDIRTDQLNVFSWRLVQEWADLYARWLLACTNVRGDEPTSGDVCIHCAVEACNNQRDGRPQLMVPNQLRHRVTDTCRQVRSTELERMDWDGCIVATVANACGEPVLCGTARAGARFVNALRPSRNLADPKTQVQLVESRKESRNLVDPETQVRLAGYYCLPMFSQSWRPSEEKHS